MAYGWSADRVRLVPLDFDRHYENCCRWVNDPEMTETLLVGDLPMTRLAEKEWFDNALRGGPNDIHFAIETTDGRHIGQSSFHRLDYRNGTALSGSFIGEAVDRGKGLGTEACILRAWYAFHVLGLRMVFSEFIEGNVASERMQTKAGYEVYGRRPKAYWKRGDYRDLVLTVLSKERFFEAHPSWSDKR